MAHRRIVRSSGPRRKTTWIGAADQDSIAIATGASGIIGSFPFGGPATIVRVRGILNIQPQTAAADLSISGAFGACFVQNEAFAAGAASLPRPFDDSSGNAWFVHQFVSYRLEFLDATGVISPMGFRADIDSKAMRKVNENLTMVFMYESQSGAANVTAHMRMLVKVA